jgi:hypothetical protein
VEFWDRSRRARPVGDRLGVRRTGLVRVVGAGCFLMVKAVDVVANAGYTWVSAMFAAKRG